jgi:Flp pilus assembly protein TadB
VRGPVRKHGVTRPFNRIVRCHLTNQPNDIETAPDQESSSSGVWQRVAGLSGVAAIVILAFWFRPYVVGSVIAVIGAFLWIVYVLVDGFGGRNKHK